MKTLSLLFKTDSSVTNLILRVAALGIASTMVVAIATVHYQYGFFMNWTGTQAGEGFEYHLLVLAMALVLIIRGGGKLSLDRPIASALNRNS